MLRSFVETKEDRSRLVRDNGRLVILSCKPAHGVQRIKQHNRYEFNLSADFAAKQLNILKAAKSPILNPDEDFLLEQRLIFVRVAEGCPSMPDSDNHVLILTFLYGKPSSAAHRRARGRKGGGLCFTEAVGAVREPPRHVMAHYETGTPSRPE